jgi:hypothetical protein
MIKIFLTEVSDESCILYSKIGGSNTILCGPVQKFAFIPGQAQRFRKEIRYLPGNLCRQVTGIEAGDTSNARAARDTRIPEGLFSYAIGSNYPKPSNYDTSPHKPLLFKTS